MSGYKYPSAEELRQDVSLETAAVNAAVSAMADAIESCPLPANLKVYAAIELAFKYGDAAYVDEVFSEVQCTLALRRGSAG